jgi:hypothetical protein
VCRRQWQEQQHQLRRQIDPEQQNAGPVTLKGLSEIAIHPAWTVGWIFPRQARPLSQPIALRYPFAAHPQLRPPALQIVHRVIATFLIKQALRSA